MEYIEGCKSTFCDNEMLLAVTRCIEYLHSFSLLRLGPLRHGVSRGVLWPEDNPPTFHSSEEMEAFINSRLVDQEPEFSMSATRLHLCHLDLALRNLLFASDSAVVILDWASAGYYPRSFEIAALRRNHGEQGRDRDFSVRLEQSVCATNPLTERELKQIDLILEFAYNDVRFCLWVIRIVKSE